MIMKYQSVNLPGIKSNPAKATRVDISSIGVHPEHASRSETNVWIVNNNYRCMVPCMKRSDAARVRQKNVCSMQVECSKAA